ncbi:hypothetical protein ID866_10988 [Astraeus odoratus]|nr:hypothetical protein ID866_10988 [Astraeus odoratus]
MEVIKVSENDKEEEM